MDPASDIGIPGTPDTPLVADLWSPKTYGRSQGDFGCLIPSGQESKLAFHAIAVKIKEDPDWEPHCRQFVIINEEQTELEDEYHDSQPDSESEEIHAPALIWTGRYRFNAAGHRFFVVGCGNEDMPHLGVDILLTLPHTRKYNKERGRHARHAVWLHERDSGAFMIKIEEKKSVYIGGEKQVPGKHYIGKPITNFRFGDLDYSFQYTGLNEETYRSQLFPESSGPPRSLSLTPTEGCRDIKGFIVHNAFEEESTCVLSTGTRKDSGQPVAVKIIRRHKYNLTRINREIEISKIMATEDTLHKGRVSVYDCLTSNIC